MQTGRVSVTQPGAGKASAINKGDQLAEGSTITTGADSELVLAPIPGSFVVIGENSRVKIEHLQFERDGKKVRSREATLRLESGSLSFGLEKVNSKVTKFVVLTPQGPIVAKGTSGTVKVRNGAVLVSVDSGRVACFGAGRNGGVVLEPGSVLNTTSGGTQVTSLIDRTTAEYDAAGALVGRRDATPEELHAARETFGAGFAIALRAVGSGALSKAFFGEITKVLKRVNKGLAAAGLQPIGGGSRSGESFISVGSGNGLVGPAVPSIQAGGGSGGGANPSNTSGAVISPEE